MIAPTPRLITRWASQAGRAPAAFDPANTRLDPRSLAEMLADIARSAADIAFHDDSGAVDGNWRRVLLADPSFVLALLVTARIDARAEPLDGLLEQARRGGSPHENEMLLTRLVEGLLRFADDLDAWLAPADLGGVTRGQSIRLLAEEVIERVLGPQLQRLVDHVAAAEEAELTAHFRHAHWHELRRPWRRAMLEGEARGVAEAVERAWADRMLRELADAVEHFLSEMRQLGRRADDALVASLASGDHSAHPALLITFAQLFAHATALLNRIPQQWIDHYQAKLLHATPAKARPDRMLLAFVPRPGTRSALLQGSLIPAGKGADGAPVSFVTDAALAVTGATLREARLWQRDATLVRFAPGPDGTLSDPLLGVAAPIAGTRAEAHAIFATPLLALRGGMRRITLALQLDGSFESGVPRLQTSVTTAEGWLPVHADTSFEAGTLRVEVNLPTDFPALGPAEVDFPDMPALRLTLAGGRTDARIRTAHLAIAVKDLPDLQVRTPSGPASTLAAAPFGTPPGPGGWLRLDHPVLAGPPLDRLVVRLDWAGLPPGDGGFADYYQGYVVDAQGQLFDWPPFDNAAFTVTLAAPVPGWDASHRVPLFAPASLGSAPPVTAALPPDIFAADFEPAPPLMPERGPLAPGSWLAAAAGPEGGTTADHICVTLAGPIFGFGQALHAANVQYAIEAIARGEAPPARRPGLFRRLLRAILGFPAKILRKIEGVESDEPEPAQPAIVLMPNPPFQPLLSGISMDYALSVTAEALTFRHAETAAPTTALPLEGALLFPASPAALILDLVFDGARPRDVLALLVRVAGADPGQHPAWHYRTAAGWQTLPSDALLADDTQGLTTTGIVRIALPADAASPTSLRLDFGDAETPPAVIAILPDAVSATRLTDGGETALAPIPAGSVTRLAGVARVLQPLDSAGGQPPEAPAMLRARTAERVRHRARAVTAWDIERLVLSDFPEIERVRVLTQGDPADGTAAAEIWVVVMPSATEAATISPQLRAAIADRIGQAASPFARVTIADPLYVRVNIAARLALDDPNLARVETALTTFLSPHTDPGLDLDDDAGTDRIRAAIARFLLAQPQIRSIERLEVTLAGPDAGWRVPVPGEIALAGVAALATASW